MGRGGGGAGVSCQEEVSHYPGGAGQGRPGAGQRPRPRSLLMRHPWQSRGRAPECCHQQDEGEAHPQPPHPQRAGSRPRGAWPEPAYPSCPTAARLQSFLGPPSSAFSWVTINFSTPCHARACQGTKVCCRGRASGRRMPAKMPMMPPLPVTWATRPIVSPPLESGWPMCDLL